MNIVNCSVKMKLSHSYETELQLLISKLRVASFADEFRYSFECFGRHFRCMFVKNDSCSDEFCWHVKHLATLANNVDILENEFNQSVFKI